MNARIELPLLLAALFFSSCQCKNLKDIVEICTKQFPSISRDYAKQFIAHNFDIKSNDEKCFASCMLIHFKLVINNEVYMDNWDGIHNEHWKEKAYRDTAHENTLACKQEAADMQYDPCEYAGKVLNCFYVKNKKSNFLYRIFLKTTSSCYDEKKTKDKLVAESCD